MISYYAALGFVFLTIIGTAGSTYFFDRSRSETVTRLKLEIERLKNETAQANRQAALVNERAAELQRIAPTGPFRARPELAR